MKIKEKYESIINYFLTHQPEAETELHYETPFQLLVAVILSAQCTDKRVNLVTPPLFAAYPVPEKLAAASFEELFPFIRSISYPNNKTKHLIGMANMLVNDFSSAVPNQISDLIKLPGVGRKTANVIVSVVFDQPAMAVDTHVFRVSNRIGLTKNAKTPLAVEQQLVKHIPEEHIAVAHHWLILHGRYVCMARQPNCAVCGISTFCNYYKKQAPKF